MDLCLFPWVEVIFVILVMVALVSAAITINTKEGYSVVSFLHSTDRVLWEREKTILKHRSRTIYVGKDGQGRPIYMKEADL